MRLPGLTGFGTLEPLPRRGIARRLVAFRIDEPVPARIKKLGERANEGNLNASERSEYEALINAADLSQS